MAGRAGTKEVMANGPNIANITSRIRKASEPDGAGVVAEAVGEAGMIRCYGKQKPDASFSLKMWIIRQQQQLVLSSMG